MSVFMPVVYQDGAILFEAGEVAHSFYLIQSGQVSIIDEESNQEIALLSAGEAFGEQSLLSMGVRSATAKAVGKTICQQMEVSGLRMLLMKNGGLVAHLFEALLLQLYTQNSVKN